MEIDYDTSYLPLHVTKLESPEGFQVWKRKMRHWLIAADLWQWTEEENSEAPTTEVPDLANDGSNELARATALAKSKEKMHAWKRGNELACNAIVSRLGSNHYYDYENETNAHRLWNGIAKDCKPFESVMLNNLYQRLTTLSITSCKDEADYTRQFRTIYNEILDINPKLKLETSFLTFLFYNGLGKEVHLPVEEGKIPWARQATILTQASSATKHDVNEMEEPVDWDSMPGSKRRKRLRE